MNEEFKIKTENTNKLVKKIQKSGFDFIGNINIKTYDKSITNGERLEFVALFVIELTRLVPEIVEGNNINIEFLEHPPNQLSIKCGESKVSVNIYEHKTGDPVNKSIPKEGIKIEKSEVLMEIMKTGYKIKIIDHMSNVPFQEKTRQRLHEAISNAEKAISSSNL